MGPDSASALPIVKALSRRVIVTSRRDGQTWRAEFDQDDPVVGPELVGRTDQTGVTIEFWPSERVFTGSIDTVALVAKLRAFLQRYPGAAVTVHDERSGELGIVVAQ